MEAGLQEPAGGEAEGDADEAEHAEDCREPRTAFGAVGLLPEQQVGREREPEDHDDQDLGLGVDRGEVVLAGAAPFLDAPERAGQERDGVEQEAHFGGGLGRRVVLHAPFRQVGYACCEHHEVGHKAAPSTGGVEEQHLARQRRRDLGRVAPIGRLEPHQPQQHHACNEEPIEAPAADGVDGSRFHKGPPNAAGLGRCCISPPPTRTATAARQHPWRPGHSRPSGARRSGPACRRGPTRWP